MKGNFVFVLSAVEVPYYSCGTFQDVCHHGGGVDSSGMDLDFYPYYHGCTGKKHQRQAKRNMSTLTAVPCANIHSQIQIQKMTA